MTGKVQSGDALIEVDLVDTHGRGKHSIEFVVDTGFKGHLTLPSEVVEALSLPFRRAITATLADGSVIETDLYAAEVVWHGASRLVGVLATGESPLLGTQLLAGSVLNSVFEENGPVTVTPITTPIDET